MISGHKSHLSIILSLLYLFTAPVLQVLPVYAAEPVAGLSVWEFMITEMLDANVIITDSAVNAAYASALSSLPAATATAAEIDSAIASAALECGVDLSSVFANTVSSAASVGVEAAAASAGENLAATCAAYYGTGVNAGQAVIPALGQIAMDAISGTAIIAGIAHICKMAYDDYKDISAWSAKISEAEDLAQWGLTTQNAGAGMNVLVYQIGPTIYKFSAGPILLGNPPNSNFFYTAYYTNCSNQTIKIGSATGNEQMTFSDMGAWQSRSAASLNKSGRYVGGIVVGDVASYMNRIRSGDAHLPLSYSPSLSGIGGRLRYNPDTSENPDALNPTMPALQPIPDINNGNGLMPVSSSDYNSIVDYINSYPEPTTYEGQQKQDLDFQQNIQTILNPYFVPIGDPSVNPDPQPTGTPDPQPTGSPNPNPNPRPDTQPFPDPEIAPQVTPVVNPTPDSEVAPAPVPYPDPATPSEQDKTDTDTKITPIDLRDKFPFCIPFDIVKIMKLFQGGREAPCFTWEIPFGQAGSGSVTVDLSPWDSAATLLRTLELILFIMLLAVGTRNLIGGSG